MTSSRGVVRAALDANVLVPASLRDTLLRAAEAGLFVPFRSDDVLAELRRTLVSNQMTSEPAATRMILAVQRTFPDATAITDASLLDLVTNDPKDRHVLAAAISTESSLIVTFNVRHFRGRDLDPHRVTATTPDTFLRRLLRDHTAQIVALLGEQAAGLKRHPTTTEDVLRRLEQFVPDFVGAVRHHVADGG